MSTRGAVAVVSSDGGWRGIWSHHDSYPTYVGQQVWSELHGCSVEQLQSFAQSLLVTENWHVYMKEEMPPEGGAIEYIDSTHPDPLFIEWVYVIDPARRQLEVLKSKIGKLGHPEVCPNMDPQLRTDGYWDYGHVAYRHTRVAVLDLTGSMPNWKQLDRRHRN